ncbi:hypothetical protein OIU84_015213 [Salix udensis]|uniref:Uncharacterized protein n=1 Tax=Salix udensis TaxID=889485 RepID=A0AAD6JDY4_9ROSI|nr:hypothetical protein OIU84_015213 [Salix udensis]
MSSIVQSFQKRNHAAALPVSSQTHESKDQDPNLFQPWENTLAAPLGNGGTGAGLGSSRRSPFFAQDLEMNEEETRVLGCHSKGSWRHVFFKVRCEVRKLVRSDDKVGLPQTYRYNSFDYSKNFDARH